RLHALADALRQNSQLARRDLPVAALPCSNRRLCERLGLLLKRHGRPRRTLVGHLVQQRGDSFRIELLFLGLGLLALLFFLALALELRLLAPFFLLKPFELSLFALFLEPPLLFGLLLLLELPLLLGLALLRLQELIELLLLLRGGRGRRGVRRWRWGRRELLL